MGRSVAGAILVLTTTGCAEPTEVPLPMHHVGDACRMLGVGGVIRGDPLDPEVVWLADPVTGERFDVRLRWPPGSVARFDPDVEIVLEGRVLLGGR